MIFKKSAPRDRKQTAWGTHAIQILQFAKIDQATVADAVGLSKQHFNNCLKGRRQPSKQNLTRINSVIAQLAGNPRVKDYLDLEAAASDLLEVQNAEGALAKAAIRCLRWYGHLFKPGAIETIENRIRALNRLQRRNLIVALNLAFHRIAFFEISPSEELAGFTEVSNALNEVGIPVEELASANYHAQLAHEHFAQTVSQVLAQQNPNGTAWERRTGVSRILTAASDLAISAYEIKIDAASKGLLESVVYEDGKRVSRFRSSTRASSAAARPVQEITLPKRRKKRRK